MPFEAWTGRKPDVRHLKTFGCQAFVHVPKSEAKKLGDRGVECIFAGYCEKRKGYKLSPVNSPHDIIHAVSVVFNENVRSQGVQ